MEFNWWQETWRIILAVFPWLEPVLWYYFLIYSVHWNSSQKNIVIWVVKKLTLSWKLEVHYCFLMTPSIDPTLRHLNSPYSFQINLILSYHGFTRFLKKNKGYWQSPPQKQKQLAKLQISCIEDHSLSDLPKCLFNVLSPTSMYESYLVNVHLRCTMLWRQWLHLTLTLIYTFYYFIKQKFPLTPFKRTAY
jgi:hypothetical protein